MLYQVQGTVVVKTADGWSSMRQVPTFYLDSEIQGLLSVEHAEKVARTVVLSAAIEGTATARVSVIAVDWVR